MLNLSVSVCIRSRDWKRNTLNRFSFQSTVSSTALLQHCLSPAGTVIRTSWHLPGWLHLTSTCLNVTHSEAWQMSYCYPFLTERVWPKKLLNSGKTGEFSTHYHKQRWLHPPHKSKNYCFLKALNWVQIRPEIEVSLYCTNSIIRVFAYFLCLNFIAY